MFKPGHSTSSNITCASSEDTNQPVYLQQTDQSSQGTLWVSKDPKQLQTDSEDWSDYANAQVNLGLRQAHVHFCRKCCALVHFVLLNSR